jgi:hypothetical protein
MSEYKRQFRDLSDETKMKISLANKGKKKSDIHKQHISQGMLDYWKDVPSKPMSGETL